MKKFLLRFASITGLIFTAQTADAQCWQVGNGADGGVYCLYPDSLHHCLYAGGGFETSGNDSFHYCGYWNDTAFCHIGTSTDGTNDSVWCFALFNGEMYIGGNFTQAGGIPVNHIARWDGTNWNPVGNGFNAAVHSLAVYNNELYAGGDFSFSGSTAINHFAQWNGSSWQAAGNGTNGCINTMQVWNSSLYLGGDFTVTGSTTVNHICEWNGSTFYPLGNGVSNNMMNYCTIRALCVYHDTLYAGGMFNTAGSVSAHHLAMWDGNTWSSAGNIGNSMMSDFVGALCVYDDMLFAGGNFGSCGSAAANNIGMWNGNSWSTIGTGMNGSVRTLGVYNNKLFIGGTFTNADGTAATNFAVYSVPTGIMPANAIENNFSMFPNPASDRVTVSWTQNETARTTITITDLNGKVISTYEPAISGKGVQSAGLITSEWENGVYLVVIDNGQERMLQKLSVIH